MVDQHRWAALLEGWLALPGPRYARLGEALRKAIREGRLGARDPLPPERTLAALVGVSRTTVVTAYDALAAEGWIERRAPGSGRAWRAALDAEAPRLPRVPAPRYDEALYYDADHLNPTGAARLAATIATAVAPQNLK